MKTLRYGALALLAALAPCCDNPFDPLNDHSHDPWLQHRVTAWHVTPGGHVRDGGPFKSIEQGWLSDSDLDTAVDAGYARYAKLFPDHPVGDHPFSINDDYVMWASAYSNGANGAWAAGTELYSHIGVVMFTRGSSMTDPSPQFIVRRPGTDQWGNPHPDFRYTANPTLVPALEHELLHSAIGDPFHTSPLWQRLSLSPRKAGRVEPADLEHAEAP